MTSKLTNSNKNSEKIVAVNKKAYHDYEILEKLETGIVLLGSELKPCREGNISLRDAYAEVSNGELWLIDANIATNPFSGKLGHIPQRRRKLLAHKKQITKLAQKVEASGMTLIPLRMYFKNGKLKVELALAKGKTKYDKREEISKKDLKRELDRALRGKY